MSLGVFISCSEAKQVTELKKFLKTHGAKTLDSLECKQENWGDDFRKCIQQLSICWKADGVSESDVNDVVTTVASLVIQLPSDQSDDVIHLLCQEYLNFSSDNTRKHKSKLFSLNLLFHGLRPDDHSKCRVYITLVLCAKKLGLVSQIIHDPKKVTVWLSKCECSVEERQEIWRVLHETHSELGDSHRATEALVYLLSTYTESTATQARQDAIKCIISFIQNPSLLAHDQLHSLKPIQFLEGEPVHDFFKIFVAGNLASFKRFLSSHPDFLTQNGLKEDACLHKLRLLTLMQISENQSNITYDFAAKELELSLDKLEPFVIEAVRQRAVACKLDQVNQRILITGAFPRTFGQKQWKNLRETLVQWHDGLEKVQQSIVSMIQMDSN